MDLAAYSKKKTTGSFYTPDYLSHFVIKRVFNAIKSQESDSKRINILEPSAGDGSFIDAISKNFSILKPKELELNIVEINKNELEKIKNIELPNKVKAIYNRADFLKKHFEHKFDLIAGNPPYIKKNSLSVEQQELSKKILIDFKVKNPTPYNIWTSFLLSSILKLKERGILALILPSEFLQVKFAIELRKIVMENFERLEIFTFDDLLFECEGQKTIALFGYKKSKSTGIFYCNIKDKSELSSETFNLKQNSKLISSSMKWTHHFLSTSEINLLNKLKARLQLIEDYSDVNAGIVTAANDFFIVNEKTTKEYNLKSYTLRIIQKGFYVNGGIRFLNEDFKFLKMNNIPCYLINFNGKNTINKKAIEYIEIGKKREINNRFKCLQRKTWFQVPNISIASEGFFFKRSHLYPKLLKNDAKVLVTDSGYRVNMKKGYRIESLIYSFYNSLTLTFAELNGRTYGGGVLELTPNEFKRLPIPYFEIEKRLFLEFADKFKKKSSIIEILNEQDKIILGSILGLSENEIMKIKMIRSKLIKNRLKILV
ncbi:MAG: N-6 DNA methylase [Leptospiraceae bacterium]|nr:N-6 DNA methylase [Leptospiraceae bacterium]